MLDHQGRGKKSHGIGQEESSKIQSGSTGCVKLAAKHNTIIQSSIPFVPNQCQKINEFDIIIHVDIHNHIFK